MTSKMKKDATRNAAYTVDCEDYVHVVEFNPFDSGDSGNLIAYGGGNYVVVGMCTFQVLEGHSDFINGLVFDPKEGQEIASVSDDHTCRIWNLEGIQTAHFVLHSPGMSVCWHPEETFKLMVAEKNGTIRFYDLLTQQAILSLESEQMPLMSAHWCLKNTFKVGAVAGSDWLIWDITRSRWSTINENLFATTGYPGKIASQFQIHHLGHPQPSDLASPGIELSHCVQLEETTSYCFGLYC
ncbi:hypothetical protein GH733_017682 [Mirounga leonina]|nr:hypothetical protein GH733_017682 [Mirounga leonina]